MQKSRGRGMVLGGLAILFGLAQAPMAMAGDGITTPGLFSQPNLFAQPKLFTVPQPIVRMPKSPTIRPMTGSECRVLLGTCTLGRLEQVGGRCFCRTAKGGLQQGTSEVRRQGR